MRYGCSAHTDHIGSCQARVSGVLASRRAWMVRASFAGLCGLLLTASLLGASKPGAQTPKSVASSNSGTSFTLVSAKAGSLRQQQVAGMIAQLRVVSYYPAANGWTLMWTNWQPAVINSDFAKIRNLGANTVRVVVFPTVFGWPTVSSTMAARFADILAMAAANGLGVQLTLFDWWDGYGEISQSQAWLSSLLQPYRADPEIRLVELKNEVDPSDAAAVAWVRALLPTLRSVMPQTPITVSVSGTEGPAGFTQLRSELDGAPLDVADMHYYGSEGSAYGWMLAAKQAAGSLPLFVGEIGDAVTEDGAGLNAAELDQAYWYEVVFAAARAAGVPAPAPWILNDFGPTAIPGTTTAEQYDFGLYTTAGQPLPAASVVRDAFTGQPSDISNLDFSLVGENGLPMLWSTSLPAQGVLAYDASVSYLKPGSVSLSATQLSPLGAPSFNLVPVNPVISGQLWNVNVWAKGVDVNGTAQLALAWFNSAGDFLGNSSSPALQQGNPGWTNLLVSARVPADATSVQIVLKSYDVAGTVWFNDVQIAVSP
jgi:hypothetical protein